MGGQSSGGGHTPYEAPDSLKSAQRLRAMGVISLGPIQGAATDDEYQSAFFDYTPIKNAQGKWNYLNTEIQYNLGTQDQLPLKGFEMSEREISVGAEVKKDHPLARTVIDPDITRLRITLGINALFSQDDQGDTHGTSVDLRILINGEARETVTITGKSSSRFHRSYLLDNLPPRPFTVSVERLTADSKSQRLQNATFWSSYTEIIDTKLSYPNMAVVGIKTDSRYNPNFPNMTFLLLGRIIKVPSNYDPQTRTYSGLWRGDFKLAWTNNPAWIFYDLVTNKLAGLGQRLGDYGVDKFQLYQIAQYCDQLVPDGYGGQEPRMVANLWITEQRDAYSVISDMASVFRAIVVWNGTQLTAIQDRTADPVCSYSQGNVIDGKFTRQYVPLKSIFTAVEVEYADERNNYQKAIEYLSDDLMIARYGYNVKKIVAFGCTSRGQARRYGKWVLETSRLEQCTINFSVGREGLRNLPGDIIEIADKSYANLNLGGRVLAVDDLSVTLDSPIELNGESYLSYLVNDDSGQHLVRRKITALDPKNKAIVTLDQAPNGLAPMDMWALHTPLVATQRYRVLTVTENEDGSYAISAIQHEPQKEAIVDNGAVFEPSASTLHKVKTELTYLGVGGSLTGGTKISWEATSSSVGVVKYDIRVLKEGKVHLYKRGESSTELDLDNLPDGEYSVTIIARDEHGNILSEKTQSFVINRPPVPTNVTVNGGLSEVTIAWDYVDNFTQTEIWAAETNDINRAQRVAKVLAHIYSHRIGARQTRYYWLRHTRGVNVGAWYQAQGLVGKTGADIEAELALLNEKLSDPIINQVFDTAAPARGLELIKAVDSLPNPAQFLGHTLVKNKADNRLYKWNGTRYDYATPAADISGTIQPGQLAQIPANQISGQLSNAQIAAIDAAKLTGTVAIDRIPPIPTTKLSGTLAEVQLPAVPTTKLSGTISAAQIAANTIGANHLQANAVTAGKIAANAVTAANVQANAITGDKIAANAVTASHLLAGAVTAGKIAANAVTAGTIATGAVVAGKLAAEAVTATNLAAGSVTAAKLAANSVAANHIQANAIEAGKIATGAVDAGHIAANAIRAQHVAAGELSADKLAVGLGGNLLTNPIFSNDGYGWIMNHNSLINGSCVFFQDSRYGVGEGGYLPNENVLRFGSTNDKGLTNAQIQVYTVTSVNAGQWYMFSAWVGNYRCDADMIIQFKDAKGVNTGTYHNRITNDNPSEGLSKSRRFGFKYLAPANTRFVWCYLRKYPTRSNSSVDSSYVWFSRPMLEECTEHTREPSPWQNAGVTAIHGGSIVTNSITAQQIAAGTITGNELVAGAIATRHLAAGAVTATELAAGAITAEKMRIGTLAAISANLGAVTAGSITGVTITGNTLSGNNISGGTISGSLINGGTIKGTRLEGATGKFTGELEVTQLIGGNIYEVALYPLLKTAEYRRNKFGSYYKHERVIRIAASAARRVIALDLMYNKGTTSYTVYGGEKYDDKYYTASTVKDIYMTPSAGTIQDGYLDVPPNTTITIKIGLWATDANPPVNGRVRITAVAISNTKSISAV